MQSEIGSTRNKFRWLLRVLGTLAALLACLWVCHGTALAWTALPEDGVSALTPEQQTLISSLPEANRPLAYCYLTGTDALSFFRQYSGYADLIAREDLTAQTPVGRYLTGTRHPDFSTAEGQREKQFLMELFIALSEQFSSYRDLSQSTVSSYYSERLQDGTLEMLQARRTDLDTKPVFNTEELPMWKSILDAWIVYRSGPAESQITGEHREAYSAYAEGAYPALDAEQQKLLAEMPPVYQLLTYAALSGTDGLSWLRENSPVEFSVIEKYWSMDRRALDDAYGALVAEGKAESDEALLVLQLYCLRGGSYIWFKTGNQYID